MLYDMRSRGALKSRHESAYARNQTQKVKKRKNKKIKKRICLKVSASSRGIRGVGHEEETKALGEFFTRSIKVEYGTRTFLLICFL